MGAAVALATSSMFITGSGAGAAKIDVSGATVTCSTLTGTIGFAPPITGTGGGNLIKIKAVLDGCSVSGAPSAVKLLPSGVTATLTGSGGGFGALNGLGTVAGTIKVTWKADPTTPLLQTSTIVTPNQTCGGIYSPAAPISGAYGLFHIGAQADCGGAGPQAAPSATGAFTGGDGGVTSVTDATTGEDVTALLGAASGKGIKTIHFGLGNIHIG